MSSRIWVVVYECPEPYYLVLQMSNMLVHPPRSVIGSLCKAAEGNPGYHENEASAVAVPVLIWYKPYIKWVGWTEVKKHQHGAGNLKDLERFCMEKWSLISCQVFSKLIGHYQRKLKAVILSKGYCKKYLIKDCQ